MADEILLLDTSGSMVKYLNEARDAIRAYRHRHRNTLVYELRNGELVTGLSEAPANGNSMFGAALKEAERRHPGVPITLVTDEALVATGGVAHRIVNVLKKGWTLEAPPTILPPNARALLIQVEQMKAGVLRAADRVYAPHVPHPDLPDTCGACKQPWPCPKVMGLEEPLDARPEPPTYNPTAALERIRELMKTGRHTELIHLFTELDTHISDGGDLPEDWEA